MKKIITILCAALLSAGVWADTAVLSKSMGANGAEAADANSITGEAGSDAEGWTIAMTGKTDKKWAHGAKDFTYNGKSYKTLKNSNGVQITVTAPAGKYASQVEFYVVSNDESADAKLAEFNGETCNDAVTAHKSDYANPTRIVKELSTPANQFTFTFGEKQVWFIAVVTCSGNTNPNCEVPQISFGEWDEIEEGFAVTLSTNEAGVSLSYSVDGADYVAYEGVFYVGSKAVVSAKASKEGYNDAIATATAPMHSTERKLDEDSFAFAEGDQVEEGMRIIAPSITLVLHDNAWQNSGVATVDLNAPEEFGYTVYVGGATNPEPKDGSIPTKGCFYTFETKADGVLQVAAKINASKNLYVATTEEKLNVEVNGQEVEYGKSLSEATYGMIKFDVKKDATYYVWCTSSKILLFGFEFAVDEGTSVENTHAAAKAVKAIRNGQVVILRDGVEYNVLGTQF